MRQATLWAHAVGEAQRRADSTGTSCRVYKAYGVFCVCPADAEYYGESVLICEPKELK